MPVCCDAYLFYHGKGKDVITNPWLSAWIELAPLLETITFILSQNDTTSQVLSCGIPQTHTQTHTFKRLWATIDYRHKHLSAADQFRLATRSSFFKYLNLRIICSQTSRHRARTSQVERHHNITDQRGSGREKPRSSDACEIG